MARHQLSNRTPKTSRRTVSGVARVALIAVIVSLLSLLVAAPAGAHDPIFVADDQTTPDTGPYMPDGTISWALYGQVLEADDTRGFEFDLRDGDELYVSLLIPNLAPETELPDAELPVLELIAPDGSSRTLTAEIRDIFDEPFSKTSYVTLLELREPGMAGRYQGVVVGGAASRFTVAIGETEIFFTETERSGDRPSTFADITGPLQVWYSTPPGGEAGEISDDVGIDLEMIDDAMETGNAVDSREADEAADVEETAEAVDDSDAEVSDEPDEAPDEAESDESDDEASLSFEESADEDSVESAVADTDSGSSTGWVAPVAILGVIALAGGGYFARRRGAAE